MYFSSELLGQYISNNFPDLINREFLKVKWFFSLTFSCNHFCYCNLRHDLCGVQYVLLRVMLIDVALFFPNIPLILFLNKNEHLYQAFLITAVVEKFNFFFLKALFWPISNVTCSCFVLFFHLLPYSPGFGGCSHPPGPVWNCVAQYLCVATDWRDDCRVATPAPAVPSGCRAVVWCRVGGVVWGPAGYSGLRFGRGKTGTCPHMHRGQ